MLFHLERKKKKLHCFKTYHEQDGKPLPPRTSLDLPILSDSAFQKVLAHFPPFICHFTEIGASARSCVRCGGTEGDMHNPYLSLGSACESRGGEPYIWDCEPREQDSRRRFVQRDGRRPTRGCVNTSAIHSQCSPAGIQSARELMPPPHSRQALSKDGSS